jgi:hypothetical protein
MSLAARILWAWSSLKSLVAGFLETFLWYLKTSNWKSHGEEEEEERGMGGIGREEGAEAHEDPRTAVGKEQAKLEWLLFTATKKKKKKKKKKEKEKNLQEQKQ